MPPNFPTMLGSAVPTMVVSSAASDMPNIRAMVTIILVFFVIDVYAYLKLWRWMSNGITKRTRHEEEIIPGEDRPLAYLCEISAAAQAARGRPATWSER